jgi:hypothetical protein
MDALNEAIDRFPPEMQEKINAAYAVLERAEYSPAPEIGWDIPSWNAAIDAAADLLSDGFLFVDRGRGRYEILPYDAEVEGRCVEACRCGGGGSNDRDVRAVLSLKR